MKLAPLVQSDVDVVDDVDVLAAELQFRLLLVAGDVSDVEADGVAPTKLVSPVV